MDLAGVRGYEAIVLAGINYRRHLNMALLDRFAEVRCQWKDSCSDNS